MIGDGKQGEDREAPMCGEMSEHHRKHEALTSRAYFLPRYVLLAA